MSKLRPNPHKVNPYDSKAYKRSTRYVNSDRPNPNSVNPYSVNKKSNPNRLKGKS